MYAAYMRDLCEQKKRDEEIKDDARLIFIQQKKTAVTNYKC